jgi:hypothetical protein
MSPLHIECDGAPGAPDEVTNMGAHDEEGFCGHEPTIWLVLQIVYNIVDIR